MYLYRYDYIYMYIYYGMVYCLTIMPQQTMPLFSKTCQHLQKQLPVLSELCHNNHKTIPFSLQNIVLVVPIFLNYDIVMTKPFKTLSYVV